MKLPTVTLMCVDCVDPERAQKVIDHCMGMVEFGAVKLLTTPEIPHLNSLVAYSIFMLTEAHKHFDTEHVLIVQRDGWILNPEVFNPEWLNLDYIGPLFVQYDKVGSGGFSLRSKRIMEATAKAIVPWDGSQEQADFIQKGVGLYEDGFISLSPFKNQFKIATPEQAAMFGHGGNRNPKYFREKPFGFHRTFAEIDFATGLIDYSDLSKDLRNTYADIIDAL